MAILLIQGYFCRCVLRSESELFSQAWDSSGHKADWQTLRKSF